MAIYSEKWWNTAKSGEIQGKVALYFEIQRKVALYFATFRCILPLFAVALFAVFSHFSLYFATFFAVFRHFFAAFRHFFAVFYHFLRNTAKSGTANIRHFSLNFVTFRILGGQLLNTTCDPVKYRHFFTKIQIFMDI